MLKTAQSIMTRLKLESFSIPIALTNRGWLTAQFRKGEKDFTIVLDAIPQTDKELKQYIKEKFIDA